MKPKSKGKRPNTLNIPIYSMEVFGDYVFLGGGGGYEISNLIQVFKYPAKMVDVPVLDKPVFEYKSDKKVANFMRMAKEGTTPILAVSMGEMVALFKIDAKSGEMIKTFEK